MKFVDRNKSYTEKNVDSQSKRKLRLLAGGQETIEFSDHLMNDPQVLIGQWISIIDKIFSKPKAEKPIGDAQYKLRDQLGAASWKIISKKLGDKAGEWVEYWQWRLHPYGERIKKDEPELKTGREYARFLGDKNPEDIDNLNGLAANIGNHFFKQERPSKLGTEIKRNRPGLIVARANAITTSNFDRRTNPKPNSHNGNTDRHNGFDFASLKIRINKPFWSVEELELYAKQSDLAIKIYRAADNHEKDEDIYWRFGTKEAGEIIFKHYGQLFGQLETAEYGEARLKVPTREEIRTAGLEGLLHLHDSIREFYKTRLRTTKKRTLEFALPKDASELFAILKFQRDNRVTNDLVRLGRVLHYEASQAGVGEFALIPDNGSDTPPHIWQISESEFRQSFWFLSDGQTEIKRAEAFVRIWRNLTSQATRSLNFWADPENHLDGDILEFSQNRKILEKAEDEEARVKTHMSLLFGREAKLFNDNAPGTLLYAANMLRIARNEIFHFRSRAQFINILSDKLSAEKINFGNIDRDRQQQLRQKFAEAAEAAGELYLRDRLAVVERHHAVLEGAWVTSFATNEQYEALLSSIVHTQSVETTLPKFNRMLARIQQGKLLQIDDKRSLPAPASMMKLKNPARKARYVALKLIYEKPFCHWLEKTSTHAQLKAWVEAAASQSTQGAKENSDHPNEAMIRSRAQQRFGEMPADTTLARFLAELSAATAREMQVQDGYRSQGDNARDQAQWIENFRCDVLGRAFREFLRGVNNENLGTDFLLKLNDGSMPSDNRAKMPDMRLDDHEQLAPEWANALYLILHLSPPDDASMLLHQLKKWQAGERSAAIETGNEAKNEGDSDAATMTLMLKIFDTYNAMHDAKFDGEGVDVDLNEFRNLFEDEKQFDLLFLDTTNDPTKDLNGDDERLAGTKRGLRQMLRFGHQKILMPIFKANPVQTSQVDKMLELEEKEPGEKQSKIAKFHAVHEKLHAAAVKTFGNDKDTDQPEDEKFDAKMLEQYREAVAQINTYQNATKMAKLVAHVQLHRLMMRVIARLVDYAGLWERDLYFISLALMKLHQPGNTHTDANALLGWLEKEYLPGGLNAFLKSGKLPNHTNDNHQSSYTKNFWHLLCHYHNPKARQTRNDLAHFNILAPGTNINLTRQVQKVREMMNYDRKLKNAVTKSIIEMIQQEGFELNWHLQGHKLDKADLKSLQLHHLAFMQKQIGDWACEAQNISKTEPLPKKNGYLSEEEFKQFVAKITRIKNSNKQITKHRKDATLEAQITKPRHDKTYQNMIKNLF